MGLGKTIQVLALLLLLKRQRVVSGPHLLVVTASLLANWSAEAARFALSLRVLVAHPSATPREDLATLAPDALARHDVVLTSYGSVHRFPWMAATRWGLVALDEPQAVKNPAARQTRAVKALPARLRLALTGTPVENRAADLWSIFDFVNPGLLGSAKRFGAFLKRASAEVPAPGARGGASPYAALRELVRPYILRRLKTDRTVIADLPEKTEVKAFCSLTRRSVAPADRMKRRGLVLPYLLRLKQICNHPSQWLGDGAYDPAKSGKLARLGEIAEVVASRQEKALVFTQFREMAAPLARFLSGPFRRPRLVRTGETRVRERAEPSSCAGSRKTRRSRCSCSRSRRAVRPEPHRRDARRPLRSMVESGGREPGHRPRLPHRADAGRARPQARLSGDGRGADRRHARREAAARARDRGRWGRGPADRARDGGAARCL